ncbi:MULTISPECIES: outer membrane protein assembly factor BamC [Halomonadaceae]|jgi:outer membrane protein assembly factor BamC|uniref:outer membrane protein assembly factor BamC n=1 Tax=Halomonadaceae TaxID=28256 RepID=UPI00022D2660|nr:outer membrane protein assembly factor BamC [Halomonas sp. HAL1]EHA17570.1 lipoprotein-34 [Halomonas sp. HAL1]WKV92244.1 outer membrane protein assembly factor BamC [Halomonas sp. HAL1]|tara:strand:- start:40660 stop:41643 length:984 start_codon:yes stop_codon:yes gene_type:complete
MSSVLEIRALKWVPLALAAAVALSGCARDGFYHDRNLDYTEAAPAPPLVLPETRNTQRYRDALPVPQAATQGTRLDEAAEIRPPQSLAIGSGLEPEYVERREVGDQTWLVVAADTGTVWPQLEEFVRSRQLNVLQSSASQGVIVTSQGEIRLQSALRAGSSEVRCESGGQTMTSCLDALESHLSARSASASVSSSWTAQRLTDEQTLQVRQQGEEWEVVIPQPVDRVWAELNHYLELDFAQEGQRDLLASDPSSHEFLVEYMTETERNRNPLQIVFSADVRKMSQEIRLALQPDGDKTILRAINASERAFSADDQRELLERVSGYLR